MTGFDAHKNDLVKTAVCLASLYNMVMAEVKRYLHFMLRVVAEDATEDILVAAVAAEEVVVAGGQGERGGGGDRGAKPDIASRS